MFKFILASLSIFLSATLQAQYDITEAFPNLAFTQPIDLQNAKDGSGRIFVAQQSGEIYSFNNNTLTTTKSLYLDISEKIRISSEQGLLGLAFHPNFSENGYLFVNYTRESDGASVIARFQEVQGVVSADSELIILTYSQPYSNHNGGSLTFGADGFLYIASGDGGSGGDPENRAQNRRSLLGKILRIDIDHARPRRNYSIPRSNPFATNTQRFRKEIYAYGLRNPWKISFDMESNKLWAGDVGQARIEEVNIIRNGGNYGWRLKEGNLDYECSEPICSNRKTIKPVYSYTHSTGTSITGGYVYRGGNFPALFGKYIFGDFVAGKIFALTKDAQNISTVELIDTDLNISSFGVDENQELYFLDYGTGKVYQFAF